LLLKNSGSHGVSVSLSFCLSSFGCFEDLGFDSVHLFFLGQFGVSQPLSVL